MKLEGVRVIDLSNYLPGPYMTMSMADHGAEVIKVEAPGEGDPTRNIGLRDGEFSVFFRNLNRGKKSVQLDLKTEEGRHSLIEMTKGADVFIESFRPGVMDRLGIGYETIRALNPGIVYCSISAFGQDGPHAGHPAHDIAVEALSGVLSIGVDEDRRPTLPGIPVADIAAALNGLAGVLMALLRRETTGLGDRVDISMHESMVAAMSNVMGPTFAEERQPDPKAERTTGGAAFYNIYETADGRHVVLGGQEPKFIRNVLGKFDRTDLVDLCLQGPGPHQRPVLEFFRETFKAKSQADWIDWFSEVDACFAPVKTLPEALVDEQIEHRQLVLRDDDGRRYLGSPIRFFAEPAAVVLKPPVLGADQALTIGTN